MLSTNSPSQSDSSLPVTGYESALATLSSMATLAQGLPFPGDSAADHHHSSRPSPYQPDPSAVRPRHYSGATETGRYTESLAAPHQLSGTPAGAAAAAVSVKGSGAVDVDRAPVRSQQLPHSYSSAPAGPSQGQGTGHPQPRERHAQQQGVDAGRAASHAGSMANSSAVRPDSFFAVEGSSTTYGANGYAQQDEGREPVRATGRATEAPQARVSSFYGTDGHIASSSRTPAQVHHQPSLQSGDSPTRSTQSMQSVRPSTVDRSSKRDSNSGSGSGSHSSHSFEQQHGAQHARPRMSQVPYSSSRAASLYGFPSSASNSAGDSIPPPPPAQLLDQSHLQVGNMASLLSHDKTLELYRLNARKTNDPDIQYEFCVFVMDVVADLEYSAMLEKAAAATGQSLDGAAQVPSDQELESKQKQQALVAESIALLNRLATRGHVNSCYFLGDCYTQGIGTYKVSVICAILLERIQR